MNRDGNGYGWFHGRTNKSAPDSRLVCSGWKKKKRVNRSGFMDLT